MRVLLVVLLACALGKGVALADARRAPSVGSPGSANTQTATKKFERVERFAQRLPELQARVAATLENPQLNPETALAAIVRIMDTTYMRVGSQRYATPKAGGRQPSFGASSLLKEHVTVSGDTVRFAFPGKSHVFWKREIKDPQLARAIALFRAQPGARLFEVQGTHGASAITERQVEGLLAQYGAKPKDFRTLHANRLLDEALAKLRPPASKTEAERNLTTAVREVASKLGHTPGICRAAYLNPKALAEYAGGL
jgi:DNA topoisomerase I